MRRHLLKRFCTHLHEQSAHALTSGRAAGQCGGCHCGWCDRLPELLGPGAAGQCVEGLLEEHRSGVLLSCCGVSGCFLRFVWAGLEGYPAKEKDGGVQGGKVRRASESIGTVNERL